VRGADHAYRVFAIGGSTTECFSLDDAQAWPAQLMTLLPVRDGRTPWIQNAGLSGHSATEHLLMLQLHPLADDADLILILVGVNDLSAALAFDGERSQPALDWEAAQEFATSPVYVRLAIYKLAKYLIFRESRRYDGPTLFERMRARRRAGLMVHMPDLSIGTAEYADRIRRLAAECRQRGKRCVFMTQPTLWHENMSRHDEALLWLGWTGSVDHPRGYVPVAELGRAMQTFNDVLMEEAARADVEAFDLAAAIPKTSEAFFDDSHFTAHGARLVAEAVAAYLMSTDEATPSAVKPL
jgi:lysophospholipase L1-like esterase